MMFRSAIAALLLALHMAVPSGAQTDTSSIVDLENAAKAGDPSAQYALGLAYHTGENVLQNYATAAAWFEKAAARGHGPAQNHLGRYLFEGLSGAKDTAKAIALLEQAALSNDPQFVFDLALVLEQSEATLPRAVTLYQQAANQGHVDASVSLGLLYQDGRGVAQDFAKARALYEPAGAKGHPRALNNLGLLYVRGNGVPQDYVRAAEYFTAASERGLRSAMGNLGVLYENGFGVPLDEEKAIELYRMSGQGGALNDAASVTTAFVYDARLAPIDTSDAGQLSITTAARVGDPVAQFQLGWLLVSAPEPGFEAYRNGALLFQAAADRGFGPAMTNLGVMYFEGWGVPQDYVLGHMWLSLAGVAGQEQAKGMQDRFSQRLTAQQIQQAQMLALEKAGRLISLPVIENDP